MTGPVLEQPTEARHAGMLERLVHGTDEGSDRLTEGAHAFFEHPGHAPAAALDRLTEGAHAFFEHPGHAPAAALDRLGTQASRLIHEHRPERGPVNRIGWSAWVLGLCGLVLVAFVAWTALEEGSGQNAWLTAPGAASAGAAATENESPAVSASENEGPATSAPSASQAAAPAAAPAAASTNAATAATGVALQIQTSGPGHPDWPRFVPADVTVHAGSPVTLTIINHDDGSAPLPSSLTRYDTVQGGVEHVDGVTTTAVPNAEVAHTWTVPSLGVNIVVPAAPSGGTNTVTFTFTPAKTGTFTWQCYAPCGDGPAGMGGAMTTDGWMRGTLTVT